MEPASARALGWGAAGRGRALASLGRRLVWLWLLVPVLALGELGAQFWAERRAPRPSDYGALVAPLRSIKQHGDVVVVAPRWAEPFVRRVLGDAVMPIADVARADMTRFDRALEISILGERAPEVAGFTERSVTRVGEFTIRALENPGHHRVVYDFVANVSPPAAAAFTELLAGEPPAPVESPCTWSTRADVLSGGLGGHPTWPRARFLCGGEFFNVGVTVIADQDFRPRQCIWAHPISGGDLVVRYRAVPLGDRIEGHGGMYWVTERPLTGAPIDLELRVDGESLGTITHRDGDGWAPWTFDLGAHARAEAATVEFRVRTPNYKDRHFCFEATSR